MAILGLDALLASSASLGSALRGIERAASGEAPILVVGEAGTGRSMLARLIHRSSARAAAALVEVDLGSVPGELFESELFGHREGAFTGAVGNSPGRVGRAEGGTLVLDHVEEIPLASQPKLLRLVAEKRFSPLGGGERRADLRLISIGSMDLRQRVASGTFRGDLFYRLEVLTFHLPPLRKRLEDLPALVDSVLADLCARQERGAASLTDSAWTWMRRYSWPGNLRQLRNVLERAMVMSPGDTLDPLPPIDMDSPPRSLEEVERAEIEKALRHTRGHQGRAAELLGISRKTLWDKRRRYGLP